MDMMKHPGIPALNALPQKERFDRFREAHQWLTAHDEEYRRRTRRFWMWMTASIIGYGCTIAALGWALTQGVLSRESFQGILLGLSPFSFISFYWPSRRYQHYKYAAIQQALETVASIGSRR